MRSIVELDGNSLTLKEAYAISQGASVLIAKGVREKVEEAFHFVQKKAKGSVPIYGVNTGFGYFAHKKISETEIKQLQVNVLKSHASGFGDPLTISETRLAMALRLNVLVKANTGVSFALCKALLDLISNDIYPYIPSYGSVGASGDLAPLAHLALPLIGEGIVNFKGSWVKASEALKQAGLTPIELNVKEGLGLINGTQVMLSLGVIAIHQAREVLRKSSLITALTYEALEASLEPLHPYIHSTRGQLGQMIVAHEILKQLEDSYLYKQDRSEKRVQDPYSLRAAPQIHGACLDAVNFAIEVIERELNSATDNPLVFPEDELILSGGNFHGEPLAFAFDIAAMALAKMSCTSERRLEVILNPHTSHLPAFLSPNEGLCSGYMSLQYLSASLVNENQVSANPACIHSIPGNVGIEDVVSMGMTSARKLCRIVQNLQTVLAIEWIASCQAIDMRQEKSLGIGTEKAYTLLRSVLPTLRQDRILSEDVKQAMELFDQL